MLPEVDAKPAKKTINPTFSDPSFGEQRDHAPTAERNAILTC
jgi:hypothetical protein